MNLGGEDVSLAAAEVGEISCDATTTRHRVEEGKVRSCRDKDMRR